MNDKEDAERQNPGITVAGDVSSRGLAIRGLRYASSRLFVGVGATYDLSEVFWAGLAYNTEVNHLGDFNYHRAVRFRF